jgi:SAM-dependent methyltransferase
MDSLADSAAIFSYHHDMLNEHGRGSSLALGWLDKQSQFVRYEALAEIADLSGHSILDAGCGYGDLLPFLNQRFTNITYTGIEQIPELLDEAIKRNINNTNGHFIQGNFVVMPLPPADYVFASGSLNYRSADPGFIYKIIEKLYAACRFGLAFNLLCKIPCNGVLVAYEPAHILDYCRSVCDNVALVTGYADEDFTIYMHKLLRSKNI